MYTQSNHSDSWRMQTLVYGLFVVETLQTILATHDSWTQLIFNLKEVSEGIFNIQFMWITIPIITGISE